MELFPFKSIDDYKFTNNTVTDNTTDLIGLDECKTRLTNWYYSSEKLFVIIGPIGCGKTALINLFCKQENILVYDYIQKKDNIKDIILFIEYTNNNIFNKTKLKKLILIDDCPSVIDIKTLLLIPNIPNILILNNTLDSKLGDIINRDNIYYINEIPPDDIKLFLKNNNLALNLKQSDLSNLINSCKSDIRLLLNNLNSTDLLKNTDIDVCKFIDNLFKSKINLSVNDLYKVYETDGYIIANLIHENYLDYSDSIDLIANSADSISYGETVFSDLYDCTKTFIPQLHFVNSLLYPVYFSKIKQTDIKNIDIRTSIINNRFNIFLNNQKTMDKINLNLIKKLSMIDIFHIKMFLNQDLVKNKTISEYQLNYLQNIMNLFPDSKIERLELIYKHFNYFKNDNLKEHKTKKFTLKFKEKLNKLLIYNGSC